ncbi:MAG: hypothetical protein RBJ76_26355 [Stenomitos frigidus ULC029]
MTQQNPSAQYCPYLIVAAFPKGMPRTIARTYNQSDAEDHVRFLQRRLPKGEFYVVFDPEAGSDKKSKE